MNSLAIDVTEEEAQRFHDVGVEFTKITGSNFDGDLFSTVMISLTSAATIKAVIPVLLEIVKTRRSGTIKVNGMEIKNVSERVILEAVKTSAPENK
jgi:hypothetical protein